MHSIRWRHFVRGPWQSLLKSNLYFDLGCLSLHSLQEGHGLGQMLMWSEILKELTFVVNPAQTFILTLYFSLNFFIFRYFRKVSLTRHLKNSSVITSFFMCSWKYLFLRRDTNLSSKQRTELYTGNFPLHLMSKRIISQVQLSLHNLSLK